MSPCYVVFDTDVEVIESHRDLELFVSSNLKWTEYVSVRQEKAYNTFHQVRRNCSVKNAVRATLDRKDCFVCNLLRLHMLVCKPCRYETSSSIEEEILQNDSSSSLRLQGKYFDVKNSAQKCMTLIWFRFYQLCKFHCVKTESFLMYNTQEKKSYIKTSSAGQRSSSGCNLQLT